MADIVNMLIDAIITQFTDNSVVDNIGQFPFADHMDNVDAGESQAVIYVGDPDDDKFRHELNKELVLIGGGAETHRPWFRRFTIVIRKNYDQTTRDAATDDFGEIMMNAEAIFYTWSTAVGPDSKGERAAIFCGQGVMQSSIFEINGGETEFQAEGKIRVEFRTS